MTSKVFTQAGGDEVLPAVEISLESVDVTPENCDEVAARMIAEQMPLHLKHRHTDWIWPPCQPYHLDPHIWSALKDREDRIPRPGERTQRQAIMDGDLTKLFYMTVTEIHDEKEAE